MTTKMEISSIDIMKDEMIKEMRGKEGFLFKRYRMDEKVFTENEEDDQMLNMLNRDPALFLEKYFRYIPTRFHSYFNSLENDEIQVLLKNYQKYKKGSNNIKIVKNRRYRFVQSQPEYFDEDQMKLRDPMLYKELIGQYEKNDDLEEDGGDTPSNKHQDIDDFEGGDTQDHMVSKNHDKTFVGRIYSDIDRMEYNRRLKEAYEEVEEEDDVESDEKVRSNDHLEQNRLELKKRMQESFMMGKDKLHFDYSQVDENLFYDDLEQEAIDVQDKYFEEEIEGPVGEVQKDQRKPKDDEYDY